MIPIRLRYNQRDADILALCESIRYIDRVSGEASTLEITVCNADFRFTRAWAATKGDSLSFVFGDASPMVFSIDKIAVSADPRTVTWVCTARPRTTTAPSGRGSGSPPPAAGAALDAKKTEATIRKITFSGLLKRVCDEAGMAYKYYPKSDPALSNVARYRESGYALLSRYCERYGFGLRATAERVSIIPASKEADAPVVSVSLAMDAVKKLGQASDLKPQKVVSARYDPFSRKVVSASAGDGDGAEVDVPFDMEDPAAVYDNAALSAMQAGVEILPDARAVAGAVVSIDGFSTFSIREMTYLRTADNESQTISARGK